MAIIFSEEYNYLFVHIPKTAGRSLSQVLISKACGQSIDRSNYMVYVDRVKHVSARVVRLILGNDRYGSMETFSVVRNPFDRLRSIYRYQRQRSWKKTPEMFQLGFNDFVTAFCAKTPQNMADWLTSENGDLIVKSILKFESLSDDFAQWSKRVVGQPLTLSTIGETQRTVEDEPYSHKSIELVRRKYARDFELFGYEVTPPLSLSTEG